KPRRVGSRRRHPAVQHQRTGPEHWQPGDQRASPGRLRRLLLAGSDRRRTAAGLRPRPRHRTPVARLPRRLPGARPPFPARPRLDLGVHPGRPGTRPVVPAGRGIPRRRHSPRLVPQAPRPRGEHPGTAGDHGHRRRLPRPGCARRRGPEASMTFGRKAVSMRVLVTGGSGRLGRSVVAVLADRGHEVTSVDLVDGPCPDGVRGVVADLLDDDARARVFAEARPEGVVHLAGIAVPFARPDLEILDINTRLAWAVLTDAVACGARCAVAASSPTVFGYNTPSWRPRYLPLDEEHPVAPWHAYGLSKLIIEETVRAVARTSGDCVVATVRPGYVIAPEEWEGAPTQQGHTVAERLANPELAAVSLFNYIDARDAGELFALILEHPERVANGQVFHAIAEDPLATRPLRELLPQFHPTTAGLAETLADSQAAFSSTAAFKALGWRARRQWRTELRENVQGGGGGAGS